MQKTRRSSKLVSFERLSPNITIPRNQKISRLTPHCVAGNLTAEATLGLSHFQTRNVRRGVSCTYAIGSNGRIGLGVLEGHRPWTSSSSFNDHRAITFEIANTSAAPDWRMSDIAINAWLNLAVDICKFYGYTKANYQPKPANITGNAQVEAWIRTWAKEDEMIITLHNWYANKACPGPYFMRQLPWLVNEITKRLKGLPPEKFIGEGVIRKNTTTETLRPYPVRISARALNVRQGPGTNHPIVTTLVSDTNIYNIVEEANDFNNRKWGRLQSGLGWISLDHIIRV